MRFHHWLALRSLVLAILGAVALAGAGRALSAAAVAAAAAAAASPATGHWEGAIEVPGSDLIVKVDLKQENGAWTGTIEIPAQSAKALPLAGIAVDGDRVHFAIDKVPGNPTFDGTLGEAVPPGKGAEIRGTFAQSGAKLPFHLGRDAIKPAARPQDPRPPFPYVEREVGYDNGKVHLAGTLTLPAGKGRFPAVLLITGSGPQNRNEEIFNHRPFWVIADHLTRAGIAVLRVDDRGVGGSTGASAADTTADFATDVMAGVRFLRAQPEIAADRVGLLGHSEGGVIAPMVASRTSDVAFIVMLAGTGVPGDQVLVRQNELIARAQHEPEDQIARALALQRQALDLVLHEKDRAALAAKLRDNARATLAVMSAEERKELGGAPDAVVDNAVRQYLSPWIRFFVTYDPRPALRQVRVPVLALNGEKDLQVDPAQNLTEIEKALHEAKNPDVTIRRLPGLNHLFQTAQTGSPAEYGKIEETFSPAALDLITRWILDRFGHPAVPAAASPASQKPSPLTLERIMADPDWLGNAPEEPYWADDGTAVYYRRKQQGHEQRDLYRLELAGGQPRRVLFAEEGKIDVGGGELSHDRQSKVYVRQGDVYVKDLGTGAIRQLTRTAQKASDARFMAGDRRVSFQVDGNFLVYDLATGLVSQPVDLRLKKDPALDPDSDLDSDSDSGSGSGSPPPKAKEEKEEKTAGNEFLRQQQRRLFDAIREKRDKAMEKRAHDQAEQHDDPSRAPLPWYLGEKIKIEQRSLAPSGDWLLLVTTPKDAKEAKKARMPSYVTASGYVEEREVRPKVGTAEPIRQSLLLLDLRRHQRYELALDGLPGIMTDPLAALRAKAAARAAAAKKEAAAKSEAAAKAAAKSEAAAKAAAKEEAGKDTGAKKNESSKPPTPEEAAASVAGAKKNGTSKPPAAEEAAANVIGAASDGDEEEGEAAKDKEKSSRPKPRPIAVAEIHWSDDGNRAALVLYSADYKDRWIATVEPGEHRLVSRHHLSDPAWINWDFNDFGWLRDSPTIYYLSEESGYSHLYLASTLDGKTRQLTHGKFEVSQPWLARDGRHLYFLANASHPGIHEVWRADVESGQTEQLTSIGGGNDFVVSPDEKQLLLLHSERVRPNEIYVQENRPGAIPRRLTETASAEFLAEDWTVPEVVPIPSTHAAGAVIYSRLYVPRTPAAATGANDGSAGSARVVGSARVDGVTGSAGVAGVAGSAGAAGSAGGRRPAVVFIHGAGYLQDAHYGWSSYFHEFMFHSLLTQHGYVVLDMDYRASAGYGRGWRTSIYRNMGHPELEDLEDGVAWLAAHQQVDPARVGVYGGSYGGFLTLMALFRKPQLFACGAALRPVTDWAHYNEPYTGGILNSPEIDPEAYSASSPIEYAAGLAKPLQICAGMQDDNVFFQDDVRLVQRLIELKKENFNLALYPLESHGFKAPVAWLDEYRRIFKLMEANLTAPATAANGATPATVGLVAPEARPRAAGAGSTESAPR